MDKENFSIKQIAEHVGTHIDNIYRIKRGDSYPSRKLAKKLEEKLGVSRIKWLYPDEYGDPWEEIKI